MTREEIEEELRRLEGRPPPLSPVEQELRQLEAEKGKLSRAGKERLGPFSCPEDDPCDERYANFCKHSMWGSERTCYGPCKCPCHSSEKRVKPEDSS